MIARSLAPIRFGSFLAPNMLSTYAAIADHVSRRLAMPATIQTGKSYDEATDAFDVCFLCGLAYIEIVDPSKPQFEPIVAPVLHGRRFGGRPVYYSDVIVHPDAPFRTFDDLRGHSWCYNEPYSQSGYGITRYCLARRGSPDFFGQIVQTGWHERSVDLVRLGNIDCATIDSHVLALLFRDQPNLRSQLRIIASLGPSTIQPVTVSTDLPQTLRDDLRDIFVNMHNDADMKAVLSHSLIKHFVSVNDSSYDDLRHMRQTCQTAGIVGKCPND